MCVMWSCSMVHDHVVQVTCEHVHSKSPQPDIVVNHAGPNMRACAAWGACVDWLAVLLVRLLLVRQLRLHHCVVLLSMRKLG
jgi:hypothetical protein